MVEVGVNQMRLLRLRRGRSLILEKVINLKYKSLRKLNLRMGEKGRRKIITYFCWKCKYCT